MNEQGRANGGVRAGGARIKVNYLVLTYLCLVHVAVASAFLLPVRHGLGARQLDLSYWVIRLFGVLGLARDVKEFSDAKRVAYRLANPTRRHRGAETRLVEL